MAGETDPNSTVPGSDNKPIQGPYKDNPDLPFVPTLATTSPDNYGRIYAENESNLHIVAGVPFEMRQHTRLPSPGLDTQAASSSYSTVARSTAGITSLTPFSSLPPELIDAILFWLPPHDLASVSATSHSLRKHCNAEIHWQRRVQDYVPFNLATTGACASFRQIFAAHSLLWFLPKYKIWFSDRSLTGRLVIARFDPRRGCIEGYQLLAVSRQRSYPNWSGDSDVIIHDFEPEVKLHLDKPTLHFGLDAEESDNPLIGQMGNRYADDVPMDIDDRRSGMFSNFMFTKAADPLKADEALSKSFPYGDVWPPPTVPARSHVFGFPAGRFDLTRLPPDDRPQRRSEVSDQSFRIRQWMEMAGSPVVGRVLGGVARYASLRPMNENQPGGTLSIHIGEDFATYSTLDPSLYTPTSTKPWRGIWVGDYSGHGCEFLLLHQADDEPATDAELGLFRHDSETNDQWEERQREARINRGRLEAIKLTGDPNVPRGEFTFVVDDLGPNGFVKTETEPPFRGARVVKSKGHVARTGFLQDKFISSHLILLGPNRLAQHWLEFGHISYFERVNIDDFVDPTIPPR